MTDRFTVRTVVLGLVAVLVGVAAAMFWLTLMDKPIPDQLDRLAVGALGAVAGILAKTSNNEDDPVRTTVVNTATDPVPVESQAGQVGVGGIIVAIVVAVVILWLLGVRL